MSSVQSKIPRLAKKEKNITHVERIQLIETEMAQALDLKHKDMSTVIMKKFKVLMESLDVMVEDVRESLKNDLKEILGVKSSISEMKNLKSSSTRKEWQQIKDTASIKTGLVEKIEGESYKIIEAVENLTFERKEISELSSKLDKAKEYITNQGKELSQNESQNHKVMESVEETIRNTDDRDGNCNIHMEVTGEGQENREDVLVKEMKEEETPQNFKNKEKILKVSREDGAILTLAADFSSATLDVSKQWSSVFNILRENDFEPKFLCHVKLAFKCDGEIRTFSDMQSLSKFTSQNSFVKELLKGVLPQNEKIKNGGRKYGIREKVDKTLIDSKHESGGANSDGLNFLFIKEVKIAEPEEVKILKTQEEESKEWKEKESLEEEEPSEPEEEGEEASELEEGEETSELEEEEEASELEEEEETSGLEEEEEETSGLEEEEEETLILCKEQHSTFQHHTMVNAKHEVEITGDSLETIIIKEVEDSEQEEEEDSEWELEVFLTWEEGKDSEVEKVEKKEASHGLKEITFNYLASDSENKKIVKHQMVQKTQNKEETATSRNQEIETLCQSLHWASPSKSFAMSTDTHKSHSCTNLNTPPGITELLRKSEKEREKTLQTKELASKETDFIQETEENFRRSVINFFREIQEEIGNIKNYHPEVLEIKNSIAVLSRRIDILEEKMSNLEDRIEEFPKDTMQMAKQIIIKERIRDIEDRSRSSNIRLIGIPEKDNKENGAEEIIKEIIEENFPELKKDSSFEIVSAYRIPSKIDEKRLTPRHILVKFGNYSDKEKIINASREKKDITYRGIRIRLTADLSLDTLDARSQWGNIIKVLQSKDFKPRILYPAKLAFDFEGKTKIFFDIEEFRKFISSTPSLKELLEDIF